MTGGPIVDAWVNIFPERFAREWTAKEENRDVGMLFGEDLGQGATVEQLIAEMDGAGVDIGILTSGLRPPERLHRKGAYAAEDFIAVAEANPGRFAVSITVDKASRPTDNARRIRELAANEHVVMARVTPLVEQYDLNHRLYYPVYAACEEAGLPVSINVGIPGPKVRSACQHPQLLEDVLIDFPGLTVVGAHMGHPYEALLVQYMLKFENLHLMTSAYLAKYMDEGLVRFMDSSRGRGRVWFASDHPVLPVRKALDAARALPLSEEAMAEFLGGSAARVLGLKTS
jgi:uncharacterized protein